MRILLWHVHGSWTTSFVSGGHEYLIPLAPDRGPDGRGRAATYAWPPAAREVPFDRIAVESVDVVVLQRPHEAALLREWTGWRAGTDVPAVYVEHDCPRGRVPWTRHRMARQRRIPIVHVTHHNSVMWDNGLAPTHVIEHGVVDPGPLWSGEVNRVAVVVNEPVRRARLAGLEVVQRLARSLPLDLFGIDATLALAAMPAGSDVRAYDDVPQARMHRELARRRAYLHPMRWTSLGLSLLEAMHLGMPVAALATTEAPYALRDGAGVTSCDVDTLEAALRLWRGNRAAAADAGGRARKAALARYGLDRFLHDWDLVLKEVAAGRSSSM